MTYSLRTILFAISILAIILAMALLPVNNKATAFHSSDELRFFKQHAMTAPPPPPIDSTQYFPTAGLCDGCHGFDPDGFALVDNGGNDVNMTDDWKATMMANSAKDPFWRAKVSHEILVNPDFSLETQTKCTSCHAPMGHYTALFRGEEHYTMDDLLNDTIGLDGVSCGACHQISPDSLGFVFSGLIKYDTNRVQFGPYLLPFSAPMANFVGFTPTHSEHINDAGICASCHTLITETFDLTGQPNGETFVEQATYHEWLNSNYNVADISCQNCHLPQIEDSVIISDNYNALGGRTPYGLHELVGGNTFMLKLMRDNRDALGIEAGEEAFDETIFSTFKMLQERTLDMEMSITGNTLDSLQLEVYLFNKAGHKFPSGYPSRRAFVELVVVTMDGDSLFQSGVLDENYEVVGHDAHYEPHYDVITDPNQVQIYELIPADVAGNFTSVLERAAYSLKDNRLVPVGFTTSHAAYDTTTIVGNALTDPNFNYENGTEGSASDRVKYHINRTDFEGGYVNVSAKVYYQSLPPKWMEEIFSASTPEIEVFKQMYEAADQSPVLVASVDMDSVFLDYIIATDDPRTEQAIVLSPNPTMDGWVNCKIPEGTQLEEILIYDLSGRFLAKHQNARFQLTGEAGVYIVKVKTNFGEVVRKVVK